MNVKPLIPHIQNVFTLSRCVALLLCSSILFLAFWIRIQGVDRIPDKQFTDTDGYFFYDQAQLIAEHGILPDRDMSRWVPIGKDLTQTLPFYGYVLAYSHKVIARFFPKVSLHHVCIYMPVVCFILGLGVLMIFFYHQFGLLFSGIIGVLYQINMIRLVFTGEETSPLRTVPGFIRIRVWYSESVRKPQIKKSTV